MRIDDDGIDTGSFETVLSLGRVGGGNHKKRALLSGFGLIGIAAEESARERIGIVSHEEEFHPRVGDDIVVIFEHPFVRARVLGKP